MTEELTFEDQLLFLLENYDDLSPEAKALLNLIEEDLPEQEQRSVYQQMGWDEPTTGKWEMQKSSLAWDIREGVVRR